MTLTYDSFLSDVSGHTMQVLRDDGLYRHLRFRENDSFCMGFDLITWPGGLCYTGDMGTYVFERIDDMFAFFRREDPAQADRYYWAQKCVSRDRDGVRQFSFERFMAVLDELLVEFVQAHELSSHDTEVLRDQVRDYILSERDYGDCQLCVAQASQFEWNGHLVFPEIHLGYNFEEFTRRFVWCCYAIPWGIAQYDASVRHQSLSGERSES